jgi:hypothetical protein
MSAAPAERARGAWRGLSSEQRLAVIAACLLLVSMLLPWYQETGFAIVDGGQSRIDDSKNAFQVYSFVEAAIFLVAAGVVVLMYARGQQKAFHLPGGDGTVVLAAGLWVMFLIFYRQLDKPDGRDGPISTSMGVSWGIFVAFLLGALLSYAGYRIRAAHVPEPDLEAAQRASAAQRAAASSPRAERAEPPTRPLRRTPPGPAAPSRPPATGDPASGQLSFDEAPDEAPTERAAPPARRPPRDDDGIPEYHPPPRRRHPG